ncbi:alpha-1,3-mannosyl-glycoprotein 4-beta-N-acetylglucosaminyltransferase B isoform X2 [Siphateles boraxobius]|uniref:alpha-1,3-mannosyl-glycoprotein 4-beta-N-acetylglucosaminyltransferase B isoform X2 n=1 Tax=Siphateles boraxobius TaxID=180520 RepID=UPI004064BCF0
MRPCHGKLFFLAGFVLCVVMLTSWHTSTSENLPLQLHSVYERLLRAEQRGEVLSQELLKVLGHLQNRSIPLSNLTISNSSAVLEERIIRHLMPSQPNALIYLPHLKEHKDSLKPIVHLGKGRTGVSLVLGLPTVHRQKQSYLVNTLQSLLYDLSTAERKDIVIVIFVAETNATFVNAVVQSVQTNLPNDVSSGLIEVISPSPHFYPDFSNLKETFGDPKERVRWRTKQNLDYSFLMLYAQFKGTYYLQLEDDIVAKQGFFESIKRYIELVLSEEWLFLEFSQLGFIGKLFRSSDLPMIVEFILMFHKDKPIDWLLDHILWVKLCNPEKDSKHCSDEKARLKRTYKPSLFQHVGLHSSLPGKIQNLKKSAAVWRNISLTLWKELTTERTFSGASHPKEEIIFSSLFPSLKLSKGETSKGHFCDSIHKFKLIQAILLVCLTGTFLGKLSLVHCKYLFIWMYKYRSKSPAAV